MALAANASALFDLLENRNRRPSGNICGYSCFSELPLVTALGGPPLAGTL
jgi:hypothetical protein